MTHFWPSPGQLQNLYLWQMCWTCQREVIATIATTTIFYILFCVWKSSWRDLWQPCFWESVILGPKHPSLSCQGCHVERRKMWWDSFFRKSEKSSKVTDFRAFFLLSLLIKQVSECGQCLLKYPWLDFWSRAKILFFFLHREKDGHWKFFISFLSLDCVFLFECQSFWSHWIVQIVNAKMQ